MTRVSKSIRRRNNKKRPAFINSAIEETFFEPTLEKNLEIDPELVVNTGHVPLGEGSLINDYDSIDAAKNWNYTAFTRTQARLDWDKVKLRTQEKENYDLRCQMAILTGKETPPELSRVDFLDEPTTPGTIIVVDEKLVNRIGIIWAGITAGAFILMCLYKLIF